MYNDESLESMVGELWFFCPNLKCSVPSGYVWSSFFCLAKSVVDASTIVHIGHIQSSISNVSLLFLLKFLISWQKLLIHLVYALLYLINLLLCIFEYFYDFF